MDVVSSSVQEVEVSGAGDGAAYIVELAAMEGTEQVSLTMA